jgi:phospholysine phosphohistidine inorganic pyrophosphate phosphatase
MNTIRAVLFDIDGVLEYQGKPYPGAAETVMKLRERGLELRFLTNSTLKSRLSAAERLNAKGIVVGPSEMVTASSATAEYLRELGSPRCWVMLEREGLDEFAGIPQDEQNPEYLVVGDNRSRFDFAHLNHALRLLTRGAKLIGMQAELLDSSLGDLELNVGSWVGMLERASGQKAIYIGKPSPYAFRLALSSLDYGDGQVLMVGDRVATDIAGAQSLGLLTALVCTGEFRPEDLSGEVQPDYVLDSVGELLNIIQ